MAQGRASISSYCDNWRWYTTPHPVLPHILLPLMARGIPPRQTSCSQERRSQLTELSTPTPTEAEVVAHGTKDCLLFAVCCRTRRYITVWWAKQTDRPLFILHSSRVCSLGKNVYGNTGGNNAKLFALQSQGYWSFCDF